MLGRMFRDGSRAEKEEFLIERREKKVYWKQSRDLRAIFMLIPMKFCESDEIDKFKKLNRWLDCFGNQWFAVKLIYGLMKIV